MKIIEGVNKCTFSHFSFLHNMLNNKNYIILIISSIRYIILKQLYPVLHVYDELY